MSNLEQKQAELLEKLKKDSLIKSTVKTVGAAKAAELLIKAIKLTKE